MKRHTLLPPDVVKLDRVARRRGRSYCSVWSRTKPTGIIIYTKTNNYFTVKKTGKDQTMSLLSKAMIKKQDYIIAIE